jgi:hypothetical protein
MRSAGAGSVLHPIRFSTGRRSSLTDDLIAAVDVK